MSKARELAEQACQDLSLDTRTDLDYIETMLSRFSAEENHELRMILAVTRMKLLKLADVLGESGMPRIKQEIYSLVGVEENKAD